MLALALGPTTEPDRRKASRGRARWVMPPEERRRDRMRDGCVVSACVISKIVFAQLPGA